MRSPFQWIRCALAVASIPSAWTRLLYQMNGLWRINENLAFKDTNIVLRSIREMKKAHIAYMNRLSLDNPFDLNGTHTHTGARAAYNVGNRNRIVSNHTKLNQFSLKLSLYSHLRPQDRVRDMYTRTYITTRAQRV